jgi:hypothetical protein
MWENVRKYLQAETETEIPEKREQCIVSRLLCYRHRSSSIAAVFMLGCGTATQQEICSSGGDPMLQSVCALGNTSSTARESSKGGLSFLMKLADCAKAKCSLCA